MYGYSNIDQLAQQAFVNRLSATANNSPLHQLTIQSLQTTPRGQEALQLVVDGAKFIHQQQSHLGVTPEQACEKAANHIHKGYLAMVFGETPMLNQNPQMSGYITELQQAAQVFNSLVMDIQRFKAGAFNQPQVMGYQQPTQMAYGQPQTQNQYGTTGIPPIAAGGMVGVPGGYHTQQPYSASNFAVSQPAQPYQTVQPNHAPVIDNPGFDPGLYRHDLKMEAAPLNFNLASPTPVNTLAPTDSWGSGIAESPQSTPPKVAVMQNNSVETVYNPHKADYATVDPRYTHHPRMEDLEIPIGQDDIKVNPFNYIPAGVVLDFNRPWDRFYAPGGIVIERADTTKFKLTKGDVAPYKSVYNPKRYCRFFAKWPDGLVVEVFAPWSDDPEMKMDYLKHETNESLKEQEALRRKARLNEVTVAEMTSGKVVPLAAVAEVIKDESVTELKNISPVLIDEIIYDLPDLEAEQKAVEIIREQIGDTVDAVPAHRYLTVNRTKVAIDDDVADVLLKLKNTDDLRIIGSKLKELVNDGLISVRTMQYFNNRLTKEINEVSQVGLSIEDYNIVDFVQYIDEYLEYFGGINKGLVACMQGAINSIAGRAFNLIKENDAWYVQDERTNIQLGLDSIELGNMEIGDTATRICPLVDNAIIQLVKDALTYNQDNDKRDVIRIRLITSDGVYLDVIRGRLKTGAMLINRVA